MVQPTNVKAALEELKILISSPDSTVKSSRVETLKDYISMHGTSEEFQEALAILKKSKENRVLTDDEKTDDTEVGEGSQPETEKLQKSETGNLADLVNDSRRKVTDETEFEGLENLAKSDQNKLEIILSLIQWLNHPTQQKYFSVDLRGKLAPFCMFMGMQSTGKSTTINKIMGIEALFTHQNTGTRCPTQLSLLPGIDSFVFEQTPLNSLEDLHKATEVHMKSIENKSELSHLPVQILIPTSKTDLGQDMSELALVLWDTPGLTSGKTEKFDQTVVNLVQDSMKEYGKLDTSWVFIVEEFAQFSQLDNRIAPRLVTEVKNLAVVVTKIDSITSDWWEGIPDHKNYSSWDDYVKAKLREKNLNVDKVFFVGQNESNIQRFKSIFPSSSINELDDLRKFISDHMLKGGDALIKSVCAVLEENRRKCEHRKRFVTKDISRQESVSFRQFINLVGNVLNALIKGDNYLTNTASFSQFQLHGYIDEYLKSLTIKEFPDFGNQKIKILGTTFHKQVQDMSDQLCAQIVNFRPDEKTIEEIAQSQNSNDVGGFASSNFLVGTLTKFFDKKIKEIEEYIESWFLVAIPKLIEATFRIVKKCSSFEHYFKNAEFVTEFRQFLDVQIREKLGLAKVINDVADLAAKYQRLPTEALKGMIIAASGTGRHAANNAKEIIKAYGGNTTLLADLKEFTEVEKAIRAFRDATTTKDQAVSFNDLARAISAFVMNTIGQVLHLTFVSGVFQLVDANNNLDNFQEMKMNVKLQQLSNFKNSLQDLPKELQKPFLMDLLIEVEKAEQSVKENPNYFNYTFEDPKKSWESQKIQLQNYIFKLNDAIANLKQTR